MILKCIKKHPIISRMSTFWSFNFETNTSRMFNFASL
jgi:hypothetical protein